MGSIIARTAEEPEIKRSSTKKTESCQSANGTAERLNQHKTAYNDLGKYEYPFENLVFEGGGNKGLSYCGALEVLEDVGIMPNIKRLGGASAGAITASLVSVGYTAEDIKGFMGENLSTLFLDHSYGYLSLLPNLLRGYGWNPGNRLLNWFGEKLQAKTGKADINFLEVYRLYGMELCIVVTNVNMMTVEYFHPKTTPTVPIKDAVRMSMSIPGIFQAVQCNVGGNLDTYVDGGALCNYPVSCYDGWWLSMKPEDNFLQRLYPLDRLQRLFEKKERFGTYNKHTLGFVVYTEDEVDLLRNILEERKGFCPPVAPDTELGKTYKDEKCKVKEDCERLREEELLYQRSVERFLNVLRKHNNNETVDIDELRNALNDPEFTGEDLHRLFGRHVTVEEAMEELDINNDKEIQFYELYRFIGRVGQSLRSKFLGYKRKEFNGFLSFIAVFHQALANNVQRLFVEEKDTERTVGINTGYIGTTDFKLQQEDKDYILQRGREGTEAFLRYYISKNNPPRKDEKGLKTKPLNGPISLTEDRSTSATLATGESLTNEHV